MPEPLTQSEYAEHRKRKKEAGADLTGTTRQAVSLKVKAGVLEDAITRIDGKVLIDPEAADRLWEDSAKNARAQKGTVYTRRRTLDGGPGETMTRAQAQAEREAANAALADLTFEKEAGRLVSRAAVRKQVFEAFRLCRDQLRGMPAKLATGLAAESDPAKVQAMIHREVSYNLADLRRKLDEL